MTKINLVHLYPKEMNIYGDTGNRLILEKRLIWRGFGVTTHLVGAGEPMPKEVDIIIGGGGQDSGQLLIKEDLIKRKHELQAMANDGVCMLMICGMYQLFGHYFLTSEGDRIPGIGVFNLVTKASDTRLIGNVTTMTEFGQIIGYENHSGLTTLADGQQPLGTTQKGQGNNGQDGSEGAQLINVFGSYLHGPILSKNPKFADEILGRALSKKTGRTVDLEPLDDSLAEEAARLASKRPR